MTPARADRLRNDGRILRAAARVLAADSSASMQAVADAAGLARLTVYRRYPDRTALVVALRSAVDAELDDALDGLPPWSSGADVLTALVRALAEVAERYPVGLLRHAPVPAAPPAADHRVAQLLRAGQAAGVVRSDVSAESLNAALFGVLSGVLDVGAGGVGGAAAVAGERPVDTVLKLVQPALLAPTSPPARARRRAAPHPSVPQPSLGGRP